MRSTTAGEGVRACVCLCESRGSCMGSTCAIPRTSIRPLIPLSAAWAWVNFYAIVDLGFRSRMMTPEIDIAVRRYE